MRKSNRFLIWFICIFLQISSLLCRAEVLNETSDNVEKSYEEELSNYTQLGIETVLSQLESMTIDQVEELAESSTYAGAIAKNWLQVKEKLGKYLEVAPPEITVNGTVIRAVSEVKYSDIPKDTHVNVIYQVDQGNNSFSCEWEITNPSGNIFYQPPIIYRIIICSVFGVAVAVTLLLMHRKRLKKKYEKESLTVFVNEWNKSREKSSHDI